MNKFQQKKGEKFFLRKKIFFSHFSVNLPTTPPNLRPFEKSSLKNGVLVEKMFAHCLYTIPLNVFLSLNFSFRNTVYYYYVNLEFLKFQTTVSRL